jgi:hypothetical protein
LIAEIFGDVAAGSFAFIEETHVLVAGCDEFGAEIGAVLFVFGVFEFDFFACEEFADGDAVGFVEVYFDEIFDFFVEVVRFVLHIESAPVDALDIFEPFVSDELIPHGQADAGAAV